MDISELTPTMPDGTPGYGPIPLMPAPTAIGMGPMPTDEGPALLITVYFANGQMSLVFDPDSADEIADEIREHTDKMRQPEIVVPAPKRGGLFLP